MPYKDRNKKNAVTKQNRDRLRAEAIAVLGGRCRSCGYDDDVRGLDICRDIDPSHRTSPMPKNHGAAVLHRAIIAGRRVGLFVLCARCNVIRVRSAGTIHANLSKPTHPDRPTPPAPGLLGAGAAGPGAGSGAL